MTKGPRFSDHAEERHHRHAGQGDRDAAHAEGQGRPDQSREDVPGAQDLRRAPDEDGVGHAHRQDHRRREVRAVGPAQPRPAAGPPGQEHGRHRQHAGQVPEPPRQRQAARIALGRHHRRAQRGRDRGPQHAAAQQQGQHVVQRRQVGIQPQPAEEQRRDDRRQRRAGRHENVRGQGSAAQRDHRQEVAHEHAGPQARSPHHQRGERQPGRRPEGHPGLAREEKVEAGRRHGPVGERQRGGGDELAPLHRQDVAHREPRERTGGHVSWDVPLHPASLPSSSAQAARKGSAARLAKLSDNKRMPKASGRPDRAPRARILLRPRSRRRQSAIAVRFRGVPRRRSRG